MQHSCRQGLPLFSLNLNASQIRRANTRVPLVKDQKLPVMLTGLTLPAVYCLISSCGNAYFQATTLFLTRVHLSFPSVEGLSSSSEYQLQELVTVDHMRCQAGQQAVHYFDDLFENHQGNRPTKWSRKLRIAGYRGLSSLPLSSSLFI
jgi:hypothetical protein